MSTARENLVANPNEDFVRVCNQVFTDSSSSGLSPEISPCYCNLSNKEAPQLTDVYLQWICTLMWDFLVPPFSPVCLTDSESIEGQRCGNVSGQFNGSKNWRIYMLSNRMTTAFPKWKHGTYSSREFFLMILIFDPLNCTHCFARILYNAVSRSNALYLLRVKY